MRLIDKDNLRKPSKGMFIYQDEFEDDVQHVAFEAYTKDDIEREPTVKAIPIEWIDGYIKRRANDVNIYAEILFTSVMVKEWEKENEHKESD